eukprot:gene3781-20962_t
MAQYVRWRTWHDPSWKAQHDAFYSDATIVGWYKAWAAHLIARVNTYQVKPEAVKINAWVREVSSFIKSKDPNHMVAVGDEGFRCEIYQD